MSEITIEQTNQFLRQQSIKDLLSFCVYNDKFFKIIKIHEIMADALMKVESWEIKKLILELPPRSWKQLAHSTPILTKTWWETHGDLKVWDYVFAPNWKAIKVEALSEESKSTLEVEFSNWEKIKCHPNHEWLVYNKRKWKKEVVETKYMIDKLYRDKTKTSWRWSGYNFSVDYCNPIQKTKKTLIVNPYVLWVWLWDWTYTKDCITQSLEDIEFTKNKFKEYWYDFRRQDIHKDTWVVTAYFNKLMIEIKELWVYGNKHIPRQYLESSIEDRLELLRGLIDSDWYIDNTGRVKFSNTNLAIIEWLEELIISLWYRCEKTNTWRAKEHLLNWKIIKSNKDIYIIAFTPYNDIQPCYIKRKLDRVKKWVYRRNTIINIKEIKPEIWRCIQVEWGLYLAWKKMIPTHNSRISSEFIAWYLWHHPEKDILLTWHSSSLLESFSRSIRNRIDSNEYKRLFKTRLAEWNTAVKSWKTSEWWEFSIFWVGWGITWKGWNILIIDDPYSWREDAESKTIKDKVWDWYKSTFLSRRHNEDAAIVLIMQRWSEDDLVWKILEWDKKKEWTEIKIPAINEEWESFWADKFSINYLKEMEEEIWSYFFSSQYQQDPINLWGWDFKKDYFNNYVEFPHDLEIVTFIDPAISQRQEADNTAIVTIWLHKQSNNIYILDVKAWRWLPDEIINKVFDTYLEYKPKRVWIEVVAYQKMLALEIKKQMNLKNIFFVLDEIRPQWEKEARIKSILQPRYSNRSILHNHKCNNLELELLKFPNWKHDDMIDALASAVNMLNTFNIQQSNNIYSPDFI